MSVIVWPNKPSSVEPVSEAGLSPSPRPVFPQFVTYKQCSNPRHILTPDFDVLVKCNKGDYATMVIAGKSNCGCQIKTSVQFIIVI